MITIFVGREFEDFEKELWRTVLIEMAGDIPSGTYNLQFGSSFNESRKDAKKFHALRYDFKPKSATNNTDTFIAFGGKNDVHVAVPTDNENMTVYKGSQKDAKPKECLLFFDQRTGTVRLEKISSNINVKQTRDLDKATESVLRNEMSRLRATNMPATTVSQISSTQSQSKEDSSSSSSSDSDSDSHSEDETPTATARQRTSSNSSMDEMESQLLATVNAPATNGMALLDELDMPSLEAHAPRPVSSARPQKSSPPMRSSHDRLGLNLSESSDSDDD